MANAGGVICAAVEYHGGTQKSAFEAIEEKVRDNTREVLEAVKAHQQLPRRGGAQSREAAGRGGDGLPSHILSPRGWIV